LLFSGVSVQVVAEFWAKGGGSLAFVWMTYGDYGVVFGQQTLEIVCACTSQVKNKTNKQKKTN